MSLTRDDILRRLAEAIHRVECAHSSADPPCVLSDHTSVEVQEFCVDRDLVLDALRALAREPGGAEAVAEAIGLRVLCRTCKGAGLVRVTQGCTCGGIDIGVGTMHEPACGMDRCDCTYLPAPQFCIVAAETPRRPSFAAKPENPDA